LLIVNVSVVFTLKLKYVACIGLCIILIIPSYAIFKNVGRTSWPAVPFIGLGDGCSL